MGVYLSTPKTEKFSEDGGNGCLKYGMSAMQGWRNSMEDAHAAILDLDENTSFFGVYDGHGGKTVSRFCAKHLHAQVLRNEAYSKGDLGQSLQNTFLRMDDMMRGHRGWRELSMLNGDKLTKINNFIGGLMSPRSSENKGFTGAKEADDEEWAFEQGTHSDFPGPTSGSTAVVALLQNDKIVVANAGDSRCVLARGGKALDLSTDHKPFLEAEKDRITQAGGFIYAGRINGTLNLARAIGDVEFKQNKYLSPDKQIVTAWPDIQIVERTEEDEFLILACDGIWDCMTSQMVVDFIHEHIHESSSLSAVCEKILDKCLAPTTTLGEGCDNMTIIVVQLKDLSNLE
ncbi:hypothetical protein GOP47_0028519 [Adiantum capillus-veneris]|nr:hypothetical protein GOP47_0028519 [Adiantum capillus-veneris]